MRILERREDSYIIHAENRDERERLVERLRHCELVPLSDKPEEAHLLIWRPAEKPEPAKKTRKAKVAEEAPADGLEDLNVSELLEEFEKRGGVIEGSDLTTKAKLIKAIRGLNDG